MIEKPDRENSIYWGEKVKASNKFIPEHIPFLHHEYEQDLETYYLTHLENHKKIITELVDLIKSNTDNPTKVLNQINLNIINNVL